MLTTCDRNYGGYSLTVLKAIGEPAVVLHRFGGSYGAAKFLLTAAQEDMEGEIRIALVNAWGVPIKVFNLNDIQVVIQDKARKPIDLVEKMTKETHLKIERIDDKSPHLQTVIELGDAHQKTLGFFREGAFRRHAALRQIIVALEPQSKCIGYLLYGDSSEYNRITIIHLCVTPSKRKKGVAKFLVDYLKEITQEYSGIGLTCRRDYNLDEFWSSLGFVAQYDKPAKTPGKLLTYWWLDYGHPNLLSTLTNQQREFKFFVVVDTEILFGLNAAIE